MSLGKLFHFSVPQFLHLSIGLKVVCSSRLSLGLNELINIKHLTGHIGRARIMLAVGVINVNPTLFL